MNRFIKMESFYNEFPDLELDYTNDSIISSFEFQGIKFIAEFYDDGSDVLTVWDVDGKKYYWDYNTTIELIDRIKSDMELMK